MTLGQRHTALDPGTTFVPPRGFSDVIARNKVLRSNALRGGSMKLLPLYLLLLLFLAVACAGHAVTNRNNLASAHSEVAD